MTIFVESWLVEADGGEWPVVLVVDVEDGARADAVGPGNVRAVTYAEVIREKRRAS